MNTLVVMKWTVNLLSLLKILGMYEGDPYGDEIDGADEDKNDGLNALVRSGFNIIMYRIYNGSSVLTKT
jgi:hypothetical protein